jgi:hypothetical protein
MPRKKYGGLRGFARCTNAGNPNLPGPNPKTTGRKNCTAMNAPNATMNAVLQPEPLFVV